MSLSNQNIEAELSYSYLHAVAGMAGMSCTVADRHEDGHGVDSVVTFRGDTGHPYITHVQLNVQLKATTQSPGTDPNYLSYHLKGIERYNKLRTNDNGSSIYKILIVLFLPTDTSAWLNCTPTELVMKEAAYWVNLYGAEPSNNTTGQTVYLPKTNILTPNNLRALARLAANKQVPPYTQP